MRANIWQRNYLIRRYLYGPALNFVCRAAFFLCGPAVRLPRLERPIFVVGCSRSGTTVFIDLFRRHPDLCDWSEGAQVFEPRYYDRDIDHAKGAADVTPYLSFRIRMLFGLKTRFAGRTRFVNKHPENALRLAFLQAIFPDAIFVHLIRDGMAAAESNFTRSHIDPFRRDWPFGQFPKPRAWRDYLVLDKAAQFAHQWIDLIAEIRAFAAAGLDATRYLEVRYEDLCADTRATLSAVDRFAALDPARRDMGSIPERLSGDNGRWRRTWDAATSAAVGAIVAPLSRELGYESADLALSYAGSGDACARGPEPRTVADETSERRMRPAYAS